jgi:hypothetical protein
MKLPRPSVRNLSLGVATLVVGIEVAGLGTWSRRFVPKAREAAEVEQVNERLARNNMLMLYAAQCFEEAEQVAATDPDKAADLRAKANQALQETPFFKIRARRAAGSRIPFQRATTRPREGQPSDEPRISTTPSKVP